jgi:DNA-binding LacI/PurR family transcriptional regulator
LEFLKANRKNPPDALVAVNDIRALAAIDALKKLKLKIPEDCAVIGFDNIPQAPISRPPLTTLIRMCQDIGKEALKLLMKFIEEPELQPLCKIMTSKLIIRESCPINVPEDLIYQEKI